MLSAGCCLPALGFRAGGARPPAGRNQLGQRRVTRPEASRQARQRAGICARALATGSATPFRFVWCCVGPEIGPAGQRWRPNTTIGHWPTVSGERLRAISFQSRRRRRDQDLAGRPMAGRAARPRRPPRAPPACRLRLPAPAPAPARPQAANLKAYPNLKNLIAR